jgi:hypothetical protein
MTALFEAALGLQNFFTRRQWQFSIIGGIALLRWGEPRFTRDVDVTLLAGFGREDEFITPILASGYRGRIPDAIEFARRNRVLLLDSPQGIPIDIALGALAFEALLIERASPYEFEPGCVLTTCSAEDLRDHRSEAAWRPQLAYIETQLAPLAEIKQQPEIMDVFSKLRRA